MEKAALIQRYWQAKVFKLLKFVGIPVTTIAFLPSVWLAYQREEWRVLITDFVVYTLFLLFALNAKYNYQLKVRLIVAILYILGMLMIFELGPYGAGFIWLMAYPVTTSVFLKKDSILKANLLILFSFMVITLILAMDWFQESKVHQYEISVWIINAINFMAVSIILSFLFAWIVNRLEITLVNSQKIKERLRRENKKINQSRRIVEEMYRKTELDSLSLKSKEEKLTLQNKELTKANTELDKFVYSVSHDLRAPLSSLDGLLHIIKTEPNEAVRLDYMEKMRQSVQRLDGFVKELIDFSRNARTKISVEKIEIKKTIGEILKGLEHLANFDKIQLTFHYDINEDFYTDATRLKMILNNLLSNAIKYSNPYSDNPHVIIKIKVDKKEFQIQVEDNGIGIEKQHLEKIYNIFYRANNLVTGSGLGLYITKEAIEVLKGSIKVSSESGKGSTFWVSLPNSPKRKKINA